MKQGGSSLLGGLRVQLLAVTVLPLTLLLLIIAFGSIYLHQQDMRALVGERDERAVQSAAAAIAAELHHRAANINNLAAFLEVSPGKREIRPDEELLDDFDGGIAMLDSQGRLITTSGRPTWLEEKNKIDLASPQTPGPIFANSLPAGNSKNAWVIVSKYSTSQDLVIAGAFSPERLMQQALAPEASADLSIYLVDASGQLLYRHGTEALESLPADHPGLKEALEGKTGTTYVEVQGVEHVVTYSPVSSTGWAIIMEEEWERVVSPSLQATQMGPLILVPAFILALLALWFVARRIVQPLQRLARRTAALAWGDFQAINEPVGGIVEIQHLQAELREMSRKVQAAQEGLRDYIGAITSAQEEERLRLARELHDDTIQAVIALKQRVQLAQKSTRDAASQHTLQALEVLAEETVEGLRRMTRALRPIYLEDLGLVTALQVLAREISQNHDIEVDFQISGDEQRRSREMELALYRIAQEALNNVVRHTQATRASMRLEFGDEETTLEVSDNGTGFQVPRQPTDFAAMGHFGLLGIRERADLIGGRLEVESSPTHGTRLSVRVPKRQS